jgi:hypothetical protein
MSLRISLPLSAISAVAALGLVVAPAFAQQPPSEDPTDPPPRAAKPAKPAKKVAAKPDLPAIGAPAKKAKAGKDDKPKVQRPFGELEGWSSAAEAEKKKMPAPPPDQSSTGYKKPPIGFDNGGNLGMGMSF